MAAVIPFSQTVFLWQSMVVALVLIVVFDAVGAAVGALRSECGAAQMLEVGVDAAPAPLHKPERSGEWLEYRPLITMVVVRARRRIMPLVSSYGQRNRGTR